MKNNHSPFDDDHQANETKNLDLYQQLVDMMKKNPDAYHEFQTMLKNEELGLELNEQQLWSQIEQLGIGGAFYAKMEQGDIKWFSALSKYYAPFEDVAFVTFDEESVREKFHTYQEEFMFSYWVAQLEAYKKQKLLEKFKDISTLPYVGTTKGPVVYSEQKPNAISWAGYAAFHHQFSLAARWLEEQAHGEEFKKIATEVLIGLFADKGRDYVNKSHPLPQIEGHDFQVLFAYLEDFWYEKVKLHPDFDSHLEVPTGFRIDSIHQALVATIEKNTEESANELIYEILADAISMNGNQNSTEWRPVDLLVRHVFQEKSCLNLADGVELLEKIDSASFGFDKNGRNLLLALSEAIFINYEKNEEIPKGLVERLDRMFARELAQSTDYIQKKWFDNVVGMWVRSFDHHQKMGEIHDQLHDSWVALNQKIPNHRIEAYFKRLKEDNLFDPKNKNSNKEYDFARLFKKASGMANAVLPMMVKISANPAELVKNVEHLYVELVEKLNEHPSASREENKQEWLKHRQSIDAAFLKLKVKKVPEAKSELNVNLTHRF